MDEVDGWCFDRKGECTVKATYPAWNQYRAACAASGRGSERASAATAGLDGAWRPNAVGRKRCGGPSRPGTVQCGPQGFCMDARTGGMCHHDCAPGFCSCYDGWCFDGRGECAIAATHPPDNAYHAACLYSGEAESRGEGSKGGGRERGKGGGAAHDLAWAAGVAERARRAAAAAGAEARAAGERIKRRAREHIHAAFGHHVEL